MSDSITYYTLKYGNKYYSPYLHDDVRSMMASVQSMLTEHRELAVRFGSKETAIAFKEMEIYNRTMTQEPEFDGDQIKIVKVTKKLHHIH